MTIISQGAEAIIELDDATIHKKRIEKSYRHPELDLSLRKSRTKREKKSLLLAKQLGINVPEVLPNTDATTLSMQHIDGTRLRDVIASGEDVTKYMKQLGNWIATLHDNSLVHGDLTTSNVMVDKEGNLFLIDFGLSFTTTKIEDKAVDIHVLEEALESTHYKEKDSLLQSFFEGYALSENAAKVSDRLTIVRSRGRNKH